MDSHWMVLFQNGVWQLRSPAKMAATVQLRCYWKQLWSRWAITGSWEPLVVVFKLTKNIIFNKTESFVGRNTSDHACQIFCSKSNCETVYQWFFLLEITVAKIMKNLKVCSTHGYLYPWSQFNTSLNMFDGFRVHQICVWNRCTGQVWSEFEGQIWRTNLTM